MVEVETIERVASSSGKQSVYGRRIARGLPHGLLLLVCAIAGFAAQHYQPDLAILDVLDEPKWAEAVGGLSFLVVAFGGLSQGRFHAVGGTFLMLLIHPWFSFMTTVLQSSGGESPFASVAAQLTDVMVSGFFPVASAFLPLAAALAVLTAIFSRRRA